MAGELRQGARLRRSARAVERPRRRAHHRGARPDLDSAEKLTGAPRQQALKKLATQLTTDATRATDRVKTRMLADAVRELVAMR